MTVEVRAAVTLAVATRPDGVYWRRRMTRSLRLTASSARLATRSAHRSHAVLFLLALTACTRSPSTPGSTTALRTQPERSPYSSACASCHGADGRGAGPAARALRTPPADLTLLAARNGGVFPRDAVVATIVGERVLPAHGSREMPVWSIRFEPSSGAAAVASIVAQQRIDAIVREIEALQRTPSK
jgi:mono/diheme cytochrome c family protein